MSFTTFFKDEEVIPLSNTHGDPLFFEIQHNEGKFNYVNIPDGSNSCVAFVTLEDKVAKTLILKQSLHSVAGFVGTQVKGLFPHYQYIPKEVRLDDIVAPFVNGVVENYDTRTTCYIRSGQLTIRSAITRGANDFVFKTNMTTDKISPKILRDKLKKWGSDDRNMRVFLNQTGVLEVYEDFVEFAQKEMNIKLEMKINRSNYSGFKAFMKKLDIGALADHLFNSKHSDDPRDRFDIMQKAAASAKKKIYNYCGMNITPYSKPHDPYIQLFGHRLQISRGNFYMIESMLRMTDKFGDYMTDIERMKLLYC